MNEVHPNKLHGSLGVGAIVLMVVATAAPLAVMVANAPMIIMLGNGVAAPADTLIATVIMYLFTIGFIAMSKHINNAGAFYAYIQKGLGRSIGLGSATLAVISYALILIAIETLVGQTLAETINDFFKIALPWWVYSLAAAGTIGFLGYRDIELSSKFLGLALTLEILAVIIIDSAILSDKSIMKLEPSAFQWKSLTSGAPGLGILFAIFSFVGFESTVIFREEAKDPERTIPRATYTAIIMIGAFYIISIWCAVTGIGASNIESYAHTHGATMYLALAESYMGGVFMDIIKALLISSLFACALSLHNIVVRYTYTLGRFGVLDNRFSNVHPVYGSPHFSSSWVTVCCVITLIVFATIGADPVGQIYPWAAMAGTLGYMVILGLTCGAVVMFFSRQRNTESLWKTHLAPSCGLIGILACLWVCISNFPDLIGGDNANSVSLMIVCFLIAMFILGFSAAERFRLRYPVRYEALRELA